MWSPKLALPGTFRQSSKTAAKQFQQVLADCVQQDCTTAWAMGRQEALALVARRMLLAGEKRDVVAAVTEMSGAELDEIQNRLEEPEVHQRATVAVEEANGAHRRMHAEPHARQPEATRSFAGDGGHLQPQFSTPHENRIDHSTVGAPPPRPDPSAMWGSLHTQSQDVQGHPNWETRRQAFDKPKTTRDGEQSTLRAPARPVNFEVACTVLLNEIDAREREPVAMPYPPVPDSGRSQQSAETATHLPPDDTPWGSVEMQGAAPTSSDVHKGRGLGDLVSVERSPVVTFLEPGPSEFANEPLDNEAKLDTGEDAFDQWSRSEPREGAQGRPADEEVTSAPLAKSEPPSTPSESQASGALESRAERCSASLDLRDEDVRVYLEALRESASMHDAQLDALNTFVSAQSDRWAFCHRAPQKMRDFCRDRPRLVQEWTRRTARAWPHGSHIRHIVPLYAGGPNEWWNLMASSWEPSAVENPLRAVR